MKMLLMVQYETYNSCLMHWIAAELVNIVEVIMIVE